MKQKKYNEILRIDARTAKQKKKLVERVKSAKSSHNNPIVKI